MSRYMLCFVLAAVSLSCRQSRDDIEGRPFLETAVKVHLPFASSGDVELVDLENGARRTSQLDENGEAEFKLFDAAGDFELLLSDVEQFELGTQTTISAGEMVWVVPVADVEKLENRLVVVNPWKHIAWAGARRNIEEYQAWMDLAERMTTCGRAELSGALNAIPLTLDSKNGDVQALTPEAWAYALFGGWSDLAVWLSREAAVQPGTRIHTMSLTGKTARDASEDGRIDSLTPDGQVQLVDGFALPPDIMRQPWAQGVRRFLDSERNALGIRSDTVVGVLECMSARAEDRWSTRGTKFDIEPPDIASEVPTEGAVLNGQQDYRCNVHDALSDVVDVDVVATRAGGRLETLLTEEEITIDGQDATYKAVADTHLVPDGQITFTCSASDQWGNSSAKAKETSSNNDAGKVAVVEPAADSVVSGDRVLVRCGCEDDHVEDCYLSEPSAEESSIIDIDDDRYILDTTGYLDGNYALECSLKSTGISEPVSNSIQVEFDNLDSTAWSGVVAMDSPVAGATVQAQIVSDDGDLDPAFATSTTDGMGRFTLDMPDDVSGWVLVTAHGVGANFRNGAVPVEGASDGQRGAIVRFRAEDKLWLLERYKPTRPGEPLGGLSVNGYSTAVAKLAMVMHAGGGAFGYVVSEANYVIGQILDRQNGMNVGRTLVRDFVTDSVFSELTDRASTRLGLGHVGLSRRGAEIAIEAGDDPNSLNSLYMLPYILRDLENAILEGRDGQAVIVNVTPLYDMNHLTMRWELATAIARWLDNAPLGGASVAMNRTTLTGAGFSGGGGFLRGMAENDSALFGDEPYRPFDQWGPDISQLELRDDSGTRIDVDGVRVRGDVTLIISASDPSGFFEDPVSVSADPGPFSLTQPESIFVTPITLEARYAIASATLNDGFQEFKVQVTDSLGNASDRSIYFRSDNTAPTVVATGPSTTRSTSITVDWEAYDDTSPIGKVLVLVGDTTVASIANPARNGTTEIELERCNETYTVTVSALDEAEWWGSGSFQVRCDNTPAELTMELSEAHTIVGETCDDDGNVTYSLGEPVSLRDLGWPGEVIELTSYANNLDVWSPYVRKIEFVASEDATAKYRYSIGAKAIHEASLASNSNGIYQLPISYQTLLPEEATPENNEMARAGPDEVHRIDVEIEDEAGNLSNYEFPFRLLIKLPPMAAINCRVNSRSGDATLSPPTVHRMFDTEQTVPIIDADLVWDTNIRDDSLMPRDPIEFSWPVSAFLSVSDYGTRLYYRSGWEPVSDYPCRLWQDMHRPDSGGCGFGFKTIDDPSDSAASGLGIRLRPGSLTFRASANSASPYNSVSPNTRVTITATRETNVTTENYLTGEESWNWPIEGGAYRLQVIETGYDYTYRPAELGDRMMRRRWVVVTVPEAIRLDAALQPSVLLPPVPNISARHPLFGNVPVRVLGTCANRRISRTW